MVSSYTTNKALEKPGYNEYINSWNVPTNSDWDIVDACFGGTVSIALTNSNVYLTTANTQNARIRLTGVLSANVIIYFPSGTGGFYIVQNATSGAYTITLSAGAGTYVTAGQSQSTFIFSDGTNITYADDIRLQLNAGAGISISSGTSPTITNTGVLSFNTRTGSVSLTSSDVTTALGYTPPTPTGTGASGTWGINITGTSTNITAYTINQNLGTTSSPQFSGLTLTGDITTYRSGSPTTGVIFFGNAGTRYLYWDGSNYSFLGATGANIFINGYVVLNAANYNSYSPTLTGGNASGTWGINITGNAATVSNGVYNNGGTYGINISGTAAAATTATTATNVSGGSVSATSGAFSSGLSVTGDITASGNVTAYSDAKIKKNVVTINDALNKVKAMRGVLYTNINTEVDGIGVIAQEMLEICPQVVQDNNGMLSVAYGNLVGVLIEAIKELSGKVAALESK